MFDSHCDVRILLTDDLVKRLYRDPNRMINIKLTSTLFINKIIIKNNDLGHETEFITFVRILFYATPLYFFRTLPLFSTIDLYLISCPIKSFRAYLSCFCENYCQVKQSYCLINVQIPKLEVVEHVEIVKFLFFFYQSILTSIIVRLILILL